MMLESLTSLYSTLDVLREGENSRLSIASPFLTNFSTSMKPET